MSAAKRAMPLWHVYACNGVIEIQSRDFGTVVKWQGFDGTDYSHQANLKNAFLMAAAPGLLEVLEGVLMMDRDKEGRIIIHGWQEDVIRAEVAKAKGPP